MFKGAYKTALATIPILLYSTSIGTASTNPKTIEDLLKDISTDKNCIEREIGTRKVKYCPRFFGETTVGNENYREVAIGYTLEGETERITIAGAKLDTSRKPRLDINIVYDNNPDGTPDSSLHESVSGVWNLIKLQAKGGAPRLLEKYSINPLEKEIPSQKDLALYNNTISRS